MNAGLRQYIEDARSKGHPDDRIRRDLLAAGWGSAAVDDGLASDGDLAVPPPPPGAAADKPAAGHPDHLVKVVPFRSTAGLEYLIMFISLWAVAMSLAAVLHSLVDGLLNASGSFYDTIATFSQAALLVSLPVFAFLFLRLKKTELAKPEIRRDTNRKNAVQLTLLVTFIIGLGKTIFYIYSLLNSGNGQNGSVLGNLLHTIITVGISGAIFVYYWVDDHRKLPS